MNGKGSSRRPCAVPEYEAALRWKLAFGSDKDKELAKVALAALKATVNVNHHPSP